MPPGGLAAAAIPAGIGAAATIGTTVAQMMNKPKTPTSFNPITSASSGPAPIEGGSSNVIPLQRGNQGNPKYAAIQEMMAGGM